MKLTIQIVNYRSRHYLQGCLFSIREHWPVEIDGEIIVINNDKEELEISDDESAEMIPLRKIELQENVGFGKAHNIGFRDSEGELVLFLNPDTKILSGALCEIINGFAKDKKIGIASPLLVDAEGKIQPNSFGSKRTPLSIILEKFFPHNRSNSRPDGDFFEVDWVSGGAMLVRRDVFEAMGGFDEKFFMYFEDVDLCLRAKQKGCKVIVGRQARIFHESGRSFESEKEKKKYYYISQDHYLKKHFGSFWAGALKLLRTPYYAKNVYLQSKNK